MTNRDTFRPRFTGLPVIGEQAVIVSPEHSATGQPVIEEHPVTVTLGTAQPDGLVIEEQAMMRHQVRRG